MKTTNTVVICLLKPHQQAVYTHMCIYGVGLSQEDWALWEFSLVPACMLPPDTRPPLPIQLTLFETLSHPRQPPSVKQEIRVTLF